MKRYRVEATSDVPTILEVVADDGDMLETRVIREFGTRREILQQAMSRALFETCLRTGYIREETDRKSGV